MTLSELERRKAGEFFRRMSVCTIVSFDRWNSHQTRHANPCEGGRVLRVSDALSHPNASIFVSRRYAHWPTDLVATKFCKVTKLGDGLLLKGATTPLTTRAGFQVAKFLVIPLRMLIPFVPDARSVCVS